MKRWRKPPHKPRRVWIRVQRHLAMNEHVLRLMVTWHGCWLWSQHNWMHE